MCIDGMRSLGRIQGHKWEGMEEHISGSIEEASLEQHLPVLLLNSLSCSFMEATAEQCLRSSHQHESFMYWQYRDHSRVVPDTFFSTRSMYGRVINSWCWVFLKATEPRHTCSVCVAMGCASVIVLFTSSATSKIVQYSEEAFYKVSIHDKTAHDVMSTWWLIYDQDEVRPGWLY